METNFWESEDRDIKITKLIEEFTKSLSSVSKSEKPGFIFNKLKEILEEKKFLH